MDADAAARPATSGPRRAAAPRVSVVLPVYQNAASLAELHARLGAVASSLGGAWEFVFVDDGSTDDSAAVLEVLQRGDARVRIVRLARNCGSYAAVLAGLSQARGQAAVVISADLQDPPELLAPLVAQWEQGHALVLAARTERDDPWPARLGARLFYALLRRGALRAMPPGGFDCCLLDRQAIERLSSRRRIVFLPGDILELGFAPSVVRYQRGPRLARYGSSRWTLWMRLRLAARVLWNYWRGPRGQPDCRPVFVIDRVIEPAP